MSIVYLCSISANNITYLKHQVIILFLNDRLSNILHSVSDIKATQVLTNKWSSDLLTFKRKDAKYLECCAIIRKNSLMVFHMDVVCPKVIIAGNSTQNRFTTLFYFYHQVSMCGKEIWYIPVLQSQRLMSRWKYQFSYDHWSQASWAQPVLRWVKLSGEWGVLL